MEKAYAKFHANYANIRAGFVSEALVDLTGPDSASEEINLKAKGEVCAHSCSLFWFPFCCDQPLTVNCIRIIFMFAHLQDLCVMRFGTSCTATPPWVFCFCAYHIHSLCFSLRFLFEQDWCAMRSGTSCTATPPRVSLWGHTPTTVAMLRR
jgi:hypothetical protein